MSKHNLSVEEGEIFYKWSISRIKRNKNVISATTGPTGSGKSYNDLRKAEIHYKNLFKEKFPIENCCFSIEQLMKKVTDKSLRKGEIIILEEAGVNAGSADWQNRIVKMFNYVLQSFRSMNIILFMNLPVLTMLSKQARQLLHIHNETKGIDFSTGKVVIKPLVLQLNQQTGKAYWKYLRTGVNGKNSAVTRISYTMPSPELVKEYEKKKQEFLDEFTGKFHKELNKIKDKDRINDENEEYAGLSPRLSQAHSLYLKGLTTKDVAREMEVSVRCASAYKLRIEQLKGARVYSSIPNTPPLLI